MSDQSPSSEIDNTESRDSDSEDNPITSSQHDSVTEPDTDTENQETTENDKRTEDPDQASKKSRELKSLLALSKEANLKTNISHKRKKESRFSTDSDKKSSKLAGEYKSVKYPVTAEAELDESHDKGSGEVNKTLKRMRDKLNDSFISDNELNSSVKKKKIFGELKPFKVNKDIFCWRCHREGVNIVCETCPRSYHQKCLKQTITDEDHWPCPECVAILRAESTQTRSSAMKGMTLEHLCSLLKFAVNRMIQCHGSEPFLHPVSDKEFPEYKNYIIQPMDLTMLEKNLKDNIYGSTQAFEADAKWILHNSIIFNSYQSKLTTAAKTMIKICKQEMMEIENCPSCYLKANTMKSTWFVEVCPKPHILVWAKLKGFPYWPAKAMSISPTGMVDVRFFGAHDRAWVHYRDCYLYSEKDPNTFKQKRFDIEKSVEELNLYIENLKKIYGEFCYAPFRTPLDSDNIDKALTIFLPKYKLIRKSIRDSTDKSEENDVHKEENSDGSSPAETHSNVNSPFPDQDTTMEGYGTDDEMQSEIDHESRKAFVGKISNNDEEDDDTQVSISAENLLLRGAVRTRGGLSNSTGKLKVIPRMSLESQTSDEALSTHSKISRRNSDLSVKSDSSRISNVSDKINRVDISGNKEVNLGNEMISSDNQLNGESEHYDIKRKPIQVDIENAELSISPNKLKISDQLIKKLANEVLNNDNTEAKKDLFKNDTDDSKIHNDKNVDSSSGKEVSSSEKINNLIEINEEHSNDDTKSDNNTEKQSISTEDEKNPIVLPDSVSLSIININSSDKVKESENNDVAEKYNLGDEITISKTTKSTANDISVDIVEEFEEGEEINNLVLDKKRIFDVIHSSLKFNKPPDDNSNDLSEDKTTTNNKPKKRKLDSLEDNPMNAKTVKLVSIESILSKNQTDDNKIKEKQPESTEKLIAAEDIKSEPESEDEPMEEEQMEEKRKYLHALNIHEKTTEADKIEKNEIRTRSKAEEKRERFKIVDNLTRVIDDVAMNYSAQHEGEKIQERKPERRKSNTVVPVSEGEIQVKSFAKLPTMPQASQLKQRARKTFPTPLYVKNPSKAPVQKKDVSLIKKDYPTQKMATLKPLQDKPSIVAVAKNLPVTTSTSSVNTIATSVPSIEVSSSKHSVTTPLTLSIATSNASVGAKSRSLAMGHVILMQTPSLSYCTPVNVVPSPSNSSTATINQPILRNFINNSNLKTNADKEVEMSSPNNQTPILNSQNSQDTSTSSNTADSATNVSATIEQEEEFAVLNGLVPESVSKAVSELLLRPPPRLKPRPPSILSQNFDEGIPSTAGDVTSKINSIAHRMTDYFRGMLLETLEDVGKASNPEATITSLRLEIEALKHRHNLEMAEMRKNMCTILKDIQKSIVEERDKIIDETRAACENETIKRVELAKSKQWCANCPREAQFYCCWNTSYCDYPCQQKHWPQHANKCTQNLDKTGAMPPPHVAGQPIVLRPALTVPSSLRKIVAKPAKVYVNKVNAGQKNIQAIPKSGLTLVATTSGNYEILGNGTIGLNGKLYTTNAPGLTNTKFTTQSTSGGPTRLSDQSKQASTSGK